MVYNQRFALVILLVVFFGTHWDEVEAKTCADIFANDIDEKVFKCLGCNGQKVQTEYKECPTKLPDDIKEIEMKCCKESHDEAHCENQTAEDFDEMCKDPTKATEAARCFVEGVKKDEETLEKGITYRQCQLKVLTKYCDLDFDVSKEELTCKGNETIGSTTEEEVPTTEAPTTEAPTTEAEVMTEAEVTTIVPAKIEVTTEPPIETTASEEPDNAEMLMCWKLKKGGGWQCKKLGLPNVPFQRPKRPKKRKSLRPKPKRRKVKKVPKRRVYVVQPPRVRKVKKVPKRIVYVAQPRRGPKVKKVPKRIVYVTQPPRGPKVKKVRKPKKQPRLVKVVPTRIVNVAQPRKGPKVKKGGKPKKQPRPDKKEDDKKCQKKVITEYYCKGVKKRKITCLSWG